VDVEIHSAHTLIVIAGAERALGRRDDAERDARAAERSLGQFFAQRFGADSRERVNRLRVRLKSLQRALKEDIPASPSKSLAADSSAGPAEWSTFVSRKNLSSRELKAYLAKIRRSGGSAECVGIVVEWALSTPRAGNIGRSPETFAVLVEELASLTLADPLPLDTHRKLFQVLHEWQQGGPWWQRLINLNRKLSLVEKLQHLKRALEAKTQHLLDSIERQVARLESLDSATILDGGGGQDFEGLLLRLESELCEHETATPSVFSPRFNSLQNRLASIIGGVDQELRRRNEVYELLLEALARASDRSTLADLQIAAKQRLPAVMQTRPELQRAFRDADDRLLLAELERLETQERSAHRAKLNSVRGVGLANLLFREYGIDPPTARKLVIDRNQGNIDLDGLLDEIFEIQRHKLAKRQT